MSSQQVYIILFLCVQIVGKNGGEDILARWPNGKGMRSVEDAFGDVLKYLTSSWDGLSNSGKSIFTLSAPKFDECIY
jgi:sacsin